MDVTLKIEAAHRHLLQVSIHIVETRRLIVINVTWIAFGSRHHYAADSAVYRSLLDLIVELRELAPNLDLLTPVDAALLMTTASVLRLHAAGFLVFGGGTI